MTARVDADGVIRWPLLHGRDLVRVVLAIVGLTLGLGVLAALLYALLVMFGFNGRIALSAPVWFFAEAAGILGGIYSVLIRSRGLTWADLGWKPVGWGWVALAVALCFAIYAVAIAIRAVVAGLQGVTDPGVLPQLAPAFPASPIAYVASLIGGAVLVPIAEEFLFRGILYRWLRDRWGVWIGTVASAAVFTAVHPPSAGAPVQIFAMALALAVLTERSRSLVPGMVLHGTNNAFGITLIYLSLWFGVS